MQTNKTGEQILGTNPLDIKKRKEKTHERNYEARKIILKLVLGMVVALNILHAKKEQVLEGEGEGGLQG